MTTPSTPRKAGPLLGNGSTTAFPFTFKVFAASDIAVTIANNLGVETALVLNTDYSVTLNANQETSPGGTVTYPISGSALPSGSKLTIIGNLPYDQPLDLPAGGNFSPLALENQLDRLAMQIQQLRELANRTLQLPVTSTVTNVGLPQPTASNIIGWNENGDNLENYPLSELATSLAFATFRYDTFNGDGVQTDFTLSADPVTLGNLDVAVSGVTQVPGADYVLANGVLQFTSAPANGTVILARFGEGIASGPSMDSYDVRFRQAGTGAVDRTAEAKMRETVNTKDYGASPTNSNAQNKTALQTAISAVAAAGGGVVVVDHDINYGLQMATPSTWPSFTGTTKPITVIDYSNCDTYGDWPGAYEGMQVRYWTHTPQTSPSIGQHDGNTFWLRADWPPYFCLSNDANYAPVGDPSRTSMDNRRAYFATHNDGVATWQIGQGTNVGAGFTDEEMSNFHIQKFAVAGDTLGDYSPMLVERKTGNISYGGGRGIPNAHHHFEPVLNSPNTYMVMVEDPYRTTVDIALRNSVGVTQDVEIKNESGDFVVVIPGQGEGLRISNANRYVGIGEPSPTYRFDLVENKDNDYVERIRNTGTTNGSITRWESSSASGSGWVFLNAYSGGTADLEFQLSGNGSGYCDGAWNGGGADYAEYFEWSDGNPDNEDRRGFSVSLVNGKIQKAQQGDAIIGVISGNPSVVGDAAWNKWAGKYLRDDFGSYVLDENGHRVLNPEYDPEAEYTPRAERPEWGCVGLVGKLRVRKNQPVGDRWIKMRDISEAVEEWLVR